MYQGDNHAGLTCPEDVLLKKRCISPVDGIFLEFCNSRILIQLRYGVLLPNGSSCTDAITFFRRVRILQFLSICVLIYRHCLCAQIRVDVLMSEKYSTLHIPLKSVDC